MPFLERLAGFALHHLTTEEKGEVFRQVSRSLRPGGVFLLVDVVRHEDESHDAHLQAACDWMRKEWHDFSPEEMATICDHVTGNDLPATVITLARRATAAGLSAPEPVNRTVGSTFWRSGKRPAETLSSACRTDSARSPRRSGGRCTTRPAALGGGSPDRDRSRRCAR